MTNFIMNNYYQLNVTNLLNIFLYFQETKFGNCFTWSAFWTLFSNVL